MVVRYLNAHVHQLLNAAMVWEERLDKGCTPCRALCGIGVVFFVNAIIVIVMVGLIVGQQPSTVIYVLLAIGSLGLIGTAFELLLCTCKTAMCCCPFYPSWNRQPGFLRLRGKIRQKWD